SAIIYFAPPKGSPLYEFNADIYVHIGVISGDSWLYVPAEWDENIEKCKMNRLDDNLWSLTLSPSIKEWFGAKTPIFKIGLVFRDATGEKKGYEEDQFLEVEDNSFKPGTIIREPQPGNTKEGINYHEGGTSVTFVLYDKDKEGKSWDYAYLIGDFTDWGVKSDFQMKRDDATGCWWYTLDNVEAMKEYAFQYFLGKEKDFLFLADAYSEKILDPWNDQGIKASTYPNLKSYPKEAVGIVSVFQTNQKEYVWNVPDFKIEDADNLIIYELLLRDFTSSSDLKGAQSKLGYLKSLGVNAIELMPVQEFDGNDSWGYNPCFYFAMDKIYGTKEDYKNFIDECHQKGIAVILDVVYNHATGSHPFAQLYWDTKMNKTSPNNPWFNVDAPHPYGVFHDFNHQEPMVREFVKRNLEFLLKEYKFDGFRFDLTKGFTQKKSTEGTAGKYDADRIAYLKEYNEAIKKVNPYACVILEHFCENKEEIELAKEGMKLWRKYNNAFYQTGMGYSEDSDFTGFYSGDVTGMPFGGYVSYMESHDEERMGYKQTQWGNWDIKNNLTSRMKRLATNAAFCFTVPGAKLIWQFGEMGYDVSIGTNDSERLERKPLHWEYLDVTERAYLHKTYTTFLNFRQDYAGLFQEDANFDWKVKESNWESGRFITLEKNGQKMFVIGNFVEKEIEVDNPFDSSGDLYDLMENKVERIYGGDRKITVPPHEFKAYVNFKID
ncbi:MAG: alpha-amylase, partial [Bacteroidales bacterium]|nr:alpha-amylase [Bacteroidales bacterium]